MLPNISIKNQYPLVISTVPRHLLLLWVPSFIPFLTGKRHYQPLHKSPQQSLLDSPIGPCICYIGIHSGSSLWTFPLFLKFAVTAISKTFSNLNDTGTNESERSQLPTALLLSWEWELFHLAKSLREGLLRPWTMHSEHLEMLRGHMVDQ